MNPRLSRAYLAALESLEEIALMATSPLQTITIPPTLTNFVRTFTPPVQLFDPALGTLTAVHLTVHAEVTSQILSQNLSPTTGADITPHVSGQVLLAGLGQNVIDDLNPSPAPAPLHVAAFRPADGFLGGASTATFPPITAEETRTFVLTSQTARTFYTATPGHRTSLQAVAIETASAGVEANVGDLQTDVRTTGTAYVTVSYDYTPAPTARQVTIAGVGLGFFGRPVWVRLSLGAAVSPGDASNPANYTLSLPGGARLAITSAAYDPATHSVLLTTSPRFDARTLAALVAARQGNGRPAFTVGVNLRG